MDRKTENIAKTFSILSQIKKFEQELLQIDGVVKVEFDLSGFYDNLDQVIFLTKYDIPYAVEDYFKVKKKIISTILKVVKENGLSRTGDLIEDYGEWFYFVTSCKDSWK